MGGSVKVGDVIRVAYPIHGDESAKSVVRFGTVEKVAGWGILVNTADGVRSLRWEKMTNKLVRKSPIVVK